MVQSGTSIYDDDLFFLVEDEMESRLYRCPKSLLPTDDKPTHAKTLQLKDANLKHCSRRLWGPKINTFANSYPEAALSADPYYGVPAVSIHSRAFRIMEDAVVQDQDLAQYGTEVRFWTSSKESQAKNNSHTQGSAGSSTTHDQPTLIPHPSALIRGSIHTTSTGAGAWALMLIVPSGRIAAIILDVAGQQSPVLSLVRFNVEKKKCTIHTLEIPQEISMSDIHGFNFDDSCGQVYLCDTSGYMHVVSYA